MARPSCLLAARLAVLLGALAAAPAHALVSASPPVAARSWAGILTRTPIATP